MQANLWSRKSSTRRSPRAPLLARAPWWLPRQWCVKAWCRSQPSPTCGSRALGDLELRLRAKAHVAWRCQHHDCKRFVNVLHCSTVWPPSVSQSMTPDQVYSACRAYSATGTNRPPSAVAQGKVLGCGRKPLETLFKSLEQEESRRGRALVAATKLGGVVARPKVLTLEPPAQSADIVLSLFSFFLSSLSLLCVVSSSLPLSAPILPIPPSLSLPTLVCMHACT